MAKITYPTPVDHGEVQKMAHSNERGLRFEHELNITNEYYRLHDKAIIYKKPTPIQVVKTSYPARVKARITEAYYTVPSTTDYNGIYRGRYLDFEAKETISQSFSFTHIYPHQVSHLEAIAKAGGIAFVIFSFTKVGEVWIIPIGVFAPLYNAAQKDHKAVQSLSIKKARQIGAPVKIGFAPPLAYLEAIDKLVSNGAFPQVEPFTIS